MYLYERTNNERKMNMKNLTIVLCLSVAACNENNFLYLEPQDSKSTQILEKIIPDVNAALGCEAWSIKDIDVNLSKDYSIVRRRVTVKQGTKAVQAVGGGAYAYFDIVQNKILYLDFTGEEGSDYFWDSVYEFIFLHEIGHAMGLKHTPETTMNKEYDYIDYPEAITSLVNLLNEKNKNPCSLLTK
jgi:hypothetical protein